MYRLSGVGRLLSIIAYNPFPCRWLDNSRFHSTCQQPRLLQSLSPPQPEVQSSPPPTYNNPATRHNPYRCMPGNHSKPGIRRPATHLFTRMARLPQPNMPRVRSEGHILSSKTGHPAPAVAITICLAIIASSTIATVMATVIAMGTIISPTSDTAPTVTPNTTIDIGATELPHFRTFLVSL